MPNNSAHVAARPHGRRLRRYQVRFYKDLSNGIGRRVTACQALVDVDAVDSRSAAEVAKERFCAARRIANWRVHADRVEVQNG